MDFVHENIKDLPKNWFSLIPAGEIPNNSDLKFACNLLLNVGQNKSLKLAVGFSLSGSCMIMFLKLWMYVDIMVDY